MFRPRTSRRNVAAGLASIAAAGSLHRGSNVSAQTPVASPLAETGAWSFPDARGGELTLQERPTRVVAQARLAMALHDYGFEVVGTFLISHETNDLEFDGDLDLSTIPDLGPWNEIDLEGLLALDADLVVDYYMSNGEDQYFWSFEDDTANRINEVVPLLTVPESGWSAGECIPWVRDLAAALGADVDAPAVLADIEAFDVASEAVRQAAAAKPGLQIASLYWWDDEVGLESPDWVSNLIFFRELGVQFTPFDLNSPPAWGNYSPEEMGTLPIDVILLLYDAPTDDPIWEIMPAVKAGQVAPNRPGTRLSHRSYARILAELAELLDRSEVVTTAFASGSHAKIVRFRRTAA